MLADALFRTNHVHFGKEYTQGLHDTIRSWKGVKVSQVHRDMAARDACFRKEFEIPRNCKAGAYIHDYTSGEVEAVYSASKEQDPAATAVKQDEIYGHIVENNGRSLLRTIA